MGKISINKEKLAIEYSKAKAEFDNFKNPGYSFMLNSLRELPLIRYSNLSYYFDNLIIEKEIVDGFIVQIEKSIKFASEHNNIQDELKLIEAYNTQQFVLSISENVL